MITVIKAGNYRFITTVDRLSVLSLDNKRNFFWEEQNEGIVLVYQSSEKKGHIVQAGKYRLYTVRGEPRLTLGGHLELLVGKGKWESFLLPSGLPTDLIYRKTIIPTNECISRSSNTEDVGIMHSIPA